MLEFTDIENGKVSISKESIIGVREYNAVNPDSKEVQSYVLLLTSLENMGSIPVQSSYEDVKKQLAS